MKNSAIIDCSDLYDDAAERLKRLDKDIDKTIQDLAKKVEARGVSKNKVARQVVKELTARGVLSPSRIYEGLGVEQKRKYKKREIEETFPQAEIIPTEKSSTHQQAIQVVTNGTGQSETLKDMNEGPDITTVSEERKQMETLREENERPKEKSELVKEMAYLREENARLKSEKEELKRQLAKKTEQIRELRKDNEGLKKDRQLEFLREIKEKFYDGPGLINAEELEKISEKEGRDIETTLQRYDTLSRDTAESGQPLPLGTYIMTKPKKVLVPVRLMINFDKRKMEVSLSEEKLQIPSPSDSV